MRTIVKNGKRVPANTQGKPAAKKKAKTARRKPIIPSKDMSKHAEARVNKSEVTWQRLFSLRDSHRAHTAKQKEHAKEEKEAAEQYLLPNLSKHEKEVLARREKEAKMAKNECNKRCKRIIVEMFDLIDGAENGEFLDLKHKPKGEDLGTAKPPENAAPKPPEPSAALPFKDRKWMARPVGELMAHGLEERALRAIREAGIRTIGELSGKDIKGLVPADEKAIEAAFKKLDQAETEADAAVGAAQK